MIYLAACSLLGAIVVALAAFSVIRALLRAQDRERQAWTLERGTLTDQICHLAGRPWAPAPASIPFVVEDEEPHLVLIGEPEQEPDF